MAAFICRGNRACAWRGTRRSRCGNPRCRSSRSTRRAPCRQRPRVREPEREFLVPACDQRSPVGDAFGGRARLGRDLGIGHDARHEAFFLRFGGVEDAAFEQQFERDGFPDEIHQRRHLGVRHHESQVLDRCAEAARRAADPQVAQRGDLEAAPHADAVDLRDQRVAAGGQRVRRGVHGGAVCDGLCLVGALGREFADVVAGGKRPLAGAADDDAANAVVGRRAHRSPRPVRSTSPWSAR